MRVITSTNDLVRTNPIMLASCWFGCWCSCGIKNS